MVVVPECMVVKPGKIPGTVLDPGILPGSNRLWGTNYLRLSATWILYLPGKIPGKVPGDFLRTPNVQVRLPGTILEYRTVPKY